MARLSWTPDWSVGVESIDLQHRALLDLLNELDDVLNAGGSRLKIQEVLISLVNHTISHFEFEEALLIDKLYPDFSAHKKEHFVLTNQVLRIPGDIIAGKEVDARAIMAFLENWLEHHILNSDKAYSEYLTGKGIR
jgi:hemerythrin-like metal-binding protein